MDSDSTGHSRDADDLVLPGQERGNCLIQRFTRPLAVRCSIGDLRLRFSNAKMKKAPQAPFQPAEFNRAAWSPARTAPRPGPWTMARSAPRPRPSGGAPPRPGGGPRRSPLGGPPLSTPRAPPPRKENPGGANAAGKGGPVRTILLA